MKKLSPINLILLVLFFSIVQSFAQEYPWLVNYDSSQTIAARISPPEGFRRTPVPQHSFLDWLRHLPLKPGKPDVLLFNGRKKNTQQVHVAVIDIDVGTRDLQQCADAVMRLRAEYLFSQKDFKAVHFNFTSGDTASFQKWSQGFRPVVRGNQVSWKKSAQGDDSYRSFKKYLQTVFTYAGSASLEKELLRVPSALEIQIGDVFIQGGFPGHAVIVVDVAINPQGEKVFLLAQSYMPAQEIHILRNPAHSTSPWYSTDFTDQLVTPEWIFNKTHLRRFR